MNDQFELVAPSPACDIDLSSTGYDVIVIDPPWPMKKIVRIVRPNQHEELDYKTLTVSEIANIKLPLAKNSHIFLWTTQKFLTSAIKVLDIWGLKYIMTFVWHKPGGFQPYNLPQFNAEFVLYARHGAPKFISTKGLKCCFDGKRGAHSEKPVEFYRMIANATTGRRIDIFSRRTHEGFDPWGDQVRKSDAECPTVY